MTRTPLGDLIAEVCESRGLTQRAFAAAIDTDRLRRSQFNNYASGNWRQILPTQLSNLATVLKVPTWRVVKASLETKGIQVALGDVVTWDETISEPTRTWMLRALAQDPGPDLPIDELSAWRNRAPGTRTAAADQTPAEDEDEDEGPDADEPPTEDE